MKTKQLLVFITTTFVIACGNYQAQAAPDVNGYTSPWEARAGNTNYNVPMATLLAHACDETITTSDSDWTKITGNSSEQYFCIDKGDHSSKGKLTLNFSGSSSAYKVIRYTRSGDTGDFPWFQASADQAKMGLINTGGQSFWIINRLTFDGPSAPVIDFPVSGGSTNIIVDHNYFLNNAASAGVVGIVRILEGNDASQGNWNMTQNNVFKDWIPVYGQEVTALEYRSAFAGFVNNEVKDLTKGPFTNGSTTPGLVRGSVIDNNDEYRTSAYYTDCNGNLTTSGTCSLGKTGIDFKRGGTAADPVIVTHNRVWGHRKTDRTNPTGCCTSTSFGQLVAIGNNSAFEVGSPEYVLLKDNILQDSEEGMGVPREGPNHISFIGNIIDLQHDYNPGDSQTNGRGYTFRADRFEGYFNSIIDVEIWMQFFGAATNHAFACNTIIDGGIKAGTPGSGTHFDFNSFYNTPVYTTESPGTNRGNYTLITRTNNTFLSVGTKIRLTATPARDGSTSDNIYIVTAEGTTASSPPSYCNTLDCSQTDGTVTLHLMRTWLKWKRKLLTVPAGEDFYIPYVVASRTYDPAVGLCPSTACNQTGAGINDADCRTLATTDVRGVTR